MENFLFKKSYQLNTFLSLPYKSLWGANGIFTTIRLYGDSPELILLDEPTSALDVSIQSQILHLLTRLQKKYELSYLCISHDLKVIRSLCDLVYIIKEGRIVESGDVDKIFDEPQHPYTSELLSSAML